MGKNKELVRLGKLNKAKFLLKQGIFKYEDVYKIICENFNVTQIKKDYLKNKYKELEKDSVYHHSKLGMDSPDEV